MKVLLKNSTLSILESEYPCLTLEIAEVILKVSSEGIPSTWIEPFSYGTNYQEHQ